MTYKRRKKEYNLCDDKSNYTFTKHPNDNKRTLTISAVKAVVDQVNTIRQSGGSPTKSSNM